MSRLSELAFTGMTLAGTYLALPVVVGAGIGSVGLRLHVENRKEDLPELLLNYRTGRERFNDGVREVGNRVLPFLKERLNYGLGDLLTEDVNFRRVGFVLGASAGAAFPVLSLYNDFSNNGESPVAGVLGAAVGSWVAWPVPTLLGGVAGFFGYNFGSVADSVLGDLRV